MGRARQEWGQQQWPGALGGHPQEQREPGPQPGPEEQPEQPLSQVGAGVCLCCGAGEEGGRGRVSADFMPLVCPHPTQ